MGWDEIERSWNELKGEVKRRWSKLTDETKPSEEMRAKTPICRDLVVVAVGTCSFMAKLSRRL